MCLDLVDLPVVLPAALQQQNKTAEQEARLAQADDAKMQQLADSMQQLEAANADLQVRLADEVRISPIDRVCCVVRCLSNVLLHVVLRRCEHLVTAQPSHTTSSFI